MNIEEIISRNGFNVEVGYNHPKYTEFMQNIFAKIHFKYIWVDLYQVKKDGRDENTQDDYLNMEQKGQEDYPIFATFLPSFCSRVVFFCTFISALLLYF